MKKIITSIYLCFFTTSILLAQCPGPAPCNFAGTPNSSFESLPAVIPSPTLCPGVAASFDISVTGNAATGDDQYITLFVDFDCDGVLETSVSSFCDFVAGVGCDVTITVPTPNVCENTTYNARAVLQFNNPITAGSVCGPIPGAAQYGDARDFTITVGDEIDPMFTAPVNQTLACGDAVPPPPVVTASDNCDASITNATANEMMSGDACAGIMVTRTWSVPADACGNMAPDQVQTIMIPGDNTPPAFTAPANMTLPCGTAVPPLTNVAATDDCDATISMATNITDNTVGTDECTGFTVTREWNAIDACGNTSPTQTQVITIEACGCGCTDPCFVEYDPMATMDDGSCVTTPPMTACSDGDPCTINDMEILGSDGSNCAPCVGTPVTPPIPSLTCPPNTINVCDGSYDCMFSDINPATDGNGVTDTPIIGGTAAFATNSAGLIDYTQLQIGATYTLTLNYEENGCFGTPITCTFTATVPNQANAGKF